MVHEAASAKSYVGVYVMLLGLLAATIGGAYLRLGVLNAAVALAIAGAKAVLIILYFMHIRGSGRRRWVFVSVGFFWLAILIALAMTDYLTRGWIAPPVGWE